MQLGAVMKGKDRARSSHFTLKRHMSQRNYPDEGQPIPRTDIIALACEVGTSLPARKPTTESRKLRKREGILRLTQAAQVCTILPSSRPLFFLPSEEHIARTQEVLRQHRR
ncbi:hypothetical protein QAD02_015013 [Eretmocerus hayati]|uniref:Uncharacterized protein n=1 Tax=Eretmocerus hayati TaxID=131215 RepID=A0ACC2P8P8_9HYME|nr:hypothetical protein QAD02_015013 [Eretmocerus hayati]